ncbi:MAG: hypothetical protein R3Y28_05075 [Candidatus Gastranaerophilales bacterium]
MKKDLQILFKNLCCSLCKSNFDENSVTIKRDEQGLLVTNLDCLHCGKNFGVAFLGFSDIQVKSQDELVLEIQDGPEPIDYDDVIDAHRFIKNLDENWQQHLPKIN